MIGGLSLFYALVVLYLWYLQKNNAALKARSPLLTHTGILFLYLDLVATTIIYSGNEEAETWDEHCYV